MKTLFLTVVISVVLCSNALADGLYLGGYGAASFVEDSTVKDKTSPYSAEVSFDIGYRFGFAAGYKWRILRFEGEFVYQQSDLDEGSALGLSVPLKGDGTAIGGMANIWADIKNETMVTPYVGGGVGFMNLEISSISLGSPYPNVPITAQDDDNVFAWQVGAGLGMPINDKLIFDLGYRYLATMDADFQLAEAGYGTHNITVGLRYHFE